MKGFMKRGNIFALVGASENPEKWGNRLYTKLKSDGFDVFPVNPKYGRIGDDKCYPDLTSLPEKPDVVITVVPPKVTEQVVRQCIGLGVKRVWMQPGSESRAAIKLCRDSGIEVVFNACFVVDGLKEGF